MQRRLQRGAKPILVSVPFNAGRGLMPGLCRPASIHTAPRFSTLQCGSWIDASIERGAAIAFLLFQYPSMRVVD